MSPKHLISALLLSLALPMLAFSANGEGWYSDMEANHSYRDGVWYLTEMGVVSGYEGNIFKPNQEVNRAEALKMILEAFDVELKSAELTFEDTSSEAWYADYLSTGLANEIVSGYEDGLFRPANTVNRAEALKMILNSAGAELNETEGEWYEPFVEIAEEQAMLLSDPEGNYPLSEELTRAELSDLIYRYFTSKYTAEVTYGVASYYADKFEGRSTASGEPYYHHLMTAAHLEYDFGTMLRVTNLDNNLSVEVEVNDRGPYAPGKHIDLSAGAFESIANLSSGLANVRIEVIEL